MQFVDWAMNHLLMRHDPWDSWRALRVQGAHYGDGHYRVTFTLGDLSWCVRCFERQASRVHGRHGTACQ